MLAFQCSSMPYSVASVVSPVTAAGGVVSRASVVTSTVAEGSDSLLASSYALKT